MRLPHYRHQESKRENKPDGILARKVLPSSPFRYSELHRGLSPLSPIALQKDPHAKDFHALTPNLGRLEESPAPYFQLRVSRLEAATHNL
jgi:hypothetical protein